MCSDYHLIEEMMIFSQLPPTSLECHKITCVNALWLLDYSFLIGVLSRSLSQIEKKAMMMILLQHRSEPILSANHQRLYTIR